MSTAITSSVRESTLTLAEYRPLLNSNNTVATQPAACHYPFAVVYGSVARGERRAESDLDIYFEASDLPREFNRTDPNSRWHVFGLPAGALLDNLRRGQQFAFDLIESALVAADRGPFRELLIVVDAEGLTPAEEGLGDRPS